MISWLLLSPLPVLLTSGWSWHFALQQLRHWLLHSEHVDWRPYHLRTHPVPSRNWHQPYGRSYGPEKFLYQNKKKLPLHTSIMCITASTTSTALHAVTTFLWPFHFNIYLLLDILVCGITEYFHELCCILTSP